MFSYVLKTDFLWFRPSVFAGGVTQSLDTGKLVTFTFRTVAKFSETIHKNESCVFLLRRLCSCLKKTTEKGK